MNKQTEALKDLLEAVEHAIEIGDWKVDGRCDPDLAINRAKKALEQPAGEVVVTKNEQGQIVCVTRQDNEGRILSIIAESEQPAQEPVLNVEKIINEFPLLDDEGLDEDKHHCEWAIQQDRKRLHAIIKNTHPAPSWQELSDDEINYASYGNTQSDGFYDGAKWAEQALKEKNT